MCILAEWETDSSESLAVPWSPLCFSVPFSSPAHLNPPFYFFLYPPLPTTDGPRAPSTLGGSRRELDAAVSPPGLKCGLGKEEDLFTLGSFGLLLSLP